MQTIKKIWSKRWVKVLTIFFGFFFVLYLFRNTILHKMGTYLVAEDPLEQTDMCFVLGGLSYERGLEAYHVYQQFPQQKFATTGANYPTQLMALDTVIMEANLTRHMMLGKGIPAENVTPLLMGTSTMEESEGILKFCQENHFTRITILSSAFHLRRVKNVFEEKFADAGIEVRYHGSTSSDFSPENWWKDEEGLITTNNEYIKLLYYAIKY